MIGKWYIDAAYGVHPDMKSHTGGNFTQEKEQQLVLVLNRSKNKEFYRSRISCNR